MSRRSSRDGAGAKQPTDYGDIAEAGGLATSSKTPVIDVGLDCMTAALARVFKAPGAAGDSGANLFYVFNGALHPFCGVFEPNASMDASGRGNGATQCCRRCPCYRRPGRTDDLPTWFG